MAVTKSFMRTCFVIKAVNGNITKYMGMHNDRVDFEKCRIFKRKSDAARSISLRYNRTDPYIYTIIPVYVVDPEAYSTALQT